MNSIEEDISATDEWRAIDALAASTSETTLRAMFDSDSERGTRLGVRPEISTSTCPRT